MNGVRPYPIVRTLLVIVAFAGATANALATAGTAAADPLPSGLSITLADGRSQVRSDLDVAYVAKLTNTGSRAVRTRVRLQLPDYVTVTTAARVEVGKHEVTWRTTVRPGTTVTRTAKAHIGTIANSDVRVIALASVYPIGRWYRVPLIRTALANTIAGIHHPANTIAGINHPAHTIAPPAAARSGHDVAANLWLLVGLPITAVVLLAGGLLWWRKRGADPARKTGDEPVSVSDEDGDLATTGQRL